MRALLVLLLAPLSLIAAEPATLSAPAYDDAAGRFSEARPPAERIGKRTNFVGCPVIRNTETPCWLAVKDGELYFLGAQGDLVSSERTGFYPPQLNHQVLIEGTIADSPRICGGIALTKLRVSVLPELDKGCNTILPADGYIGPVGARGNGPAGKRGGPAPGIPVDPPLPPAPKPPFSTQTYHLEFDFDSDRLLKEAQLTVWKAAVYAKTANATRIEVVGHRGATRLDDGSALFEMPEVAATRAKLAERALRRVGVANTIPIALRWEETPADADEHGGPSSRNVTIEVTVP